MTTSDTATDIKAALVIIGDEILSGRTQDKNLGYLANWLNDAAIQLAEVRVVPDVEAEIVTAVNALRAKYDYVFTTGGIGPTHDDITAACIAKAFGRELIVNPDAHAILEDYYGADNFTPARQRMARTPDGASLIKNPVSAAPGFSVENVFTMAGVPKVMQAMLEQIRGDLKAGRKVWSETLVVHAPESEIAQVLAEAEAEHDGVSIGSYPFFREGRVGAEAVVRSPEKEAISDAIAFLKNAFADASVEHT